MHIGAYFIVEGFEDIAARFLGEAGEEVDFGAHDHEMRRGIELDGCFSQLGKDHESQQEGADNVGGDGRLVILKDAIRPRGDSGILHNCVQSVQAFRLLYELLHGFVARQV